MSRPHLLDQRIEGEYPVFRTAADVRAFEAVPYRERIAANSTYEALQAAAALDPAAPAVHFLRTGEASETPLTLSYAQFLGGVTQAANLFTDLGVGPNDVVSFLLPLLPQALLTLFGAEAAGIANPVNPLLEPYQIAEILKAAGTKVLVALAPLPGTDIWDKVQKVRGELPHLKAIVQVGGPGDAANGIVSFDAKLPTYPADKLTSGRKIAAADVAAFFHTGGTTGTPKLVRHTHAIQLYEAWAVNLMVKARPGDTLPMGLPLFHVGGALSQCLTSFASGGAIVLLTPSGWRNPVVVRNIWRLIERYRTFGFSSVPTVLAAALATPTAGADIRSLRYVYGGGSAIPVEVAKGLQELTRAPVLEVYGMTETSSVFTMSYPDRPVRLGAVGHALPYSRVRIVKLNGQGGVERDCAVNEIGVVAMSGPGVFSGYLNDKHNQGAFVEAGWVNSGDLGRLDEDGYLWITGRAKDLIIRGGHNIDPLPIEEILYQHPAVGLAAVVGQPDAYAGELPVAFVQLKPGVQADPAELLEFIRQRAPERAAVPVNLYAVSPMPLTAVGKVFKPELRWTATERVYAQALANLANQGIDLSVHVGAHPTHGTLATIAFRGVPAAARGSIGQQVHERLSPFVIRHEIRWD
jgi:fatty-acyl-CoA synthase